MHTKFCSDRWSEKRSILFPKTKSLFDRLVTMFAQLTKKNATEHGAEQRNRSDQNENGSDQRVMLAKKILHRRITTLRKTKRTMDESLASKIFFSSLSNECPSAADGFARRCGSISDGNTIPGHVERRFRTASRTSLCTSEFRSTRAKIPIANEGQHFLSPLTVACK